MLDAKHYAPSAPDLTSSVERPIHLTKQFAERFGIAYRRFAGEIFTDVGGGFVLDHRHRTDGFVFFAEILLAFAAIGKEQDFVRQEMPMHLLEQRFGFRRLSAFPAMTI